MAVRLTQQEQAILGNSHGEVMQKVMATIVAYADALNADRLVEITGMGHFVITHALTGISPSLEMLDELISAGLKTTYPFTVDPVAPLDYDNWWLNAEQIHTLQCMYRRQNPYDRKLRALGRWRKKGCTCTPYLAEVGNLPKRGDILAWSESACVVYANSVLGARSSRNGAIIDLLCNIAGKTPFTGLLTDQGRLASWRIEVKTNRLPLPQVLGAAIGKIVLADVPYIAGLDSYLGSFSKKDINDYLHDLGAAAAAAGAVGLFHVENITPEAIDYKTDLLMDGLQTAIINDKMLKEMVESFPNVWKNKTANPQKCFLGCPHLSINQLIWWTNEIYRHLLEQECRQLKVNTTICAAPDVLEKFSKKYRREWEILTSAGVRFSPACSMQVFDNHLSQNDSIITNSTKLRTYTHARFFPDDEIADILVTGRIRNDR